MRLKFFSFFALLAITGSCPPAQACFPCWFWGASTSQRQAASDQARESSPALQLIAADLNPIVQPYGIRESEIRKAFDTAYHKQQFASEDAKTAAYKKWKDTIGSATEKDGRWHYVYERQGPWQITNRGIQGQVAYIDADLHPDSSLAFAIRAPAKGFDAQLGLELGLERESGAGLFARMSVAFGGREGITMLRANWFEGNDNYRSFRAQRRKGVDAFDAANATFTGKMANRFYGLSAQKIRSRNTGDAFEVTFLPEPEVPSNLR